MENSSFMIGIAIAVIFVLSKFIEKKYVVKEDIAVKHMVRDSLLVYVSAIAGLFVINQVGENVSIASPTVAFTGTPDF
jgi:positive regulator of sigma E activity